MLKTDAKEIDLEVKCKRCGHEWETKFDKKPKTCTGCNSPFWQKELTEYWRLIRENNKKSRGENV